MQKWLKRLSILSLLGFPVAVLGTRLGIFGFRIGILIVAITLIIALLAFLASAFCLLKRRFDTEQGAKSLKTSMFISALPLIGIGWIILGAAEVPKIHNISTDVADPPAFDKIVELRTAEHNSLEYDVAEFADLQLAAYPNIKTLYVDMSLQDAQARANDVISDLGWLIINNDTQQGIIEASQTSKLWGFTDDIVVRLRSNSTDDQTAIDLRSVSRVGQSDLGVNAGRIQAFIDSFEN